MAKFKTLGCEVLHYAGLLAPEISGQALKHSFIGLSRKDMPMNRLAGSNPQFLCRSLERRTLEV